MERGNHGKSVGLIGLGFMGSALAERLLKAGFEVTGYDVDPAKTDRLAAQGGQTAASVLEVGQSCVLIVLAVYDTEQVIEVVEGKGSLTEAAAGSKRSVICVSTCKPDMISKLATRAARAGISIIEFPLSGNSAQVLAGAATGLIAGEAGAIAKAGAVLETLCPRRFEIGQPGNASRAKLAINLVLQLNRAALAEGLVFAEQLGLDPRAFLKVLAASPAHSDVMEAKGEKMVQGDFTPESRIAQTLKDAQLMLDEARRLRQSLPLMEVNAALLAASIELGGADRDSSAIIDAVRMRR